MSFLLEDEAQATLAEALAFIDTFAAEEEELESGVTSDNSSATSDSSLYVELRFARPPASSLARSSGLKRVSSSLSPISSSSESSTSSRSSARYSADCSSSGSDDVVDSEHRKMLKLRAANTRAVNRYRTRNKTEILELREQVLQLDAHLSQLRKRGAVDSCRDGLAASYARTSPAIKLLRLNATPTPGFENAVSEYRKLQASEELNQKLKEALVKQRGIHASLEGIFQKQISKIDLSFVMDIEDKLQKKSAEEAHQVMLPRTDATIYAELFHYLETTLYGNTKAVLSQFNKRDVDCVYNNTLLRKDARYGKTLEFISNAPIACGLERIDTLLWSNFKNSSGGSNSCESDAQLSDVQCAKQFTMNFNSKMGDWDFDGMSAVRKFVEPHRIVIGYTSLLAAPGAGLYFRENGWVVLSDAHASGCTTAPTLLQTVYNLHVERQDARASVSSCATAELIEFVLNGQGERMRQFLLMIQNMLLHQLDSIPACAIMSMCPTVQCGA